MLFKTSGDKVKTLLAELVASADVHKDAADEARLNRWSMRTPGVPRDEVRDAA